MCQSLVAIKTFTFYCRKWFFFTAADDCCFYVAGAAFQGLIACGGKIVFLFSIACGGKKSTACGGKWVSLMPGYIKPIACGSKLLGLLHSRTQGRFYEEGRDTVHVPSFDAFHATWWLLLLIWILLCRGLCCCSCTYCGLESDDACVREH